MVKFMLPNGGILMATKSGRSKTGARKQPGRARKSVKRRAKRSKASAKRGSVSAKKAASTRPERSAAGRQKKVAYGSQGDAPEPKFFIIFKKAMAPYDIYVVAVYDDNRLENRSLTDSKTLSDLEHALSALPVTVEFAHLLEKNDEIFRCCGPSLPWPFTG